MFHKILFTIIALNSYLFSGQSIVSHDKPYYTKDVRNTQLIYTKDNIKDAEYVAEVEEVLQPMYEEYFGYKMYSKLYVGLVSDNNQIANGFSTQYPLNRQINYIGGTQSIDYFTNTSWLDSLIYHESTHNYQLNAKGSSVSRGLSSVFGSGSFFIPWFTIPNGLTSSFMLEGNAVLNESWHGIGGRLYSGRFKAITLMQARSKRLTPQLQYNETLDFPYHEQMYINGSYYNYYLAKTYGLKKTNSFWVNNSKDWWLPLYTNSAMKASVGKDFEDTMEDFQTQMYLEAKNMNVLDGEKIATSKFFNSMNSDEKEIYFTTNETGYSTPKLVRVNKATKEVKKETRSFKGGRLIKHKDEFYTQGSAHSNPWRIYQGLLDDNASFLEGTKSKMIQGYLSNGKPVYFDVKKSYYKAQLYVGDEFYATINSSVYIDKEDNLYYFVQRDKTRTLYKNKTALFNMESFYGLVSGINSKGDIYFISNSKYGSSLYKFDGKKITRASKADNIIEARLINDKEVVLAGVSDKEFYFVKKPLEQIDQKPYVVKLFMEDKPYYKKASVDRNKDYKINLDLNDSYYSVLDMHYSGTNLSIGADVNAGLQYKFSIAFSDPLDQNTFSIFSSRDLNEITLAGVGYKNNQYFVEYNLQAYAVLDKNETSSARDAGITAKASIPLIKQGYWNASLDSVYYQDYEVASREPLTVAFNISRLEQFGLSFKPNSLYALNAYASQDLAQTQQPYQNYGADLSYAHELFWQSYVRLYAKYSATDAQYENTNTTRGVKISNTASQFDPTSIKMTNVLNTDYLSEATKASAKLETVFDGSMYFFTFPWSLRRESLYFNYSYYDLKYIQTQEIQKVNEFTVGLTLDIISINMLPTPVSFEYVINDNETIAEKEKFSFLLGFTF